MDKDRQINKIEKIIENYNEITGLTDGWMDGIMQLRSFKRCHVAV